MVPLDRALVSSYYTLSIVPMSLTAVQLLNAMQGHYAIDAVLLSKLRQHLHWLPVRQRIDYKLSVITYRTRSTGNPAYLHHLIHDYLPARTLRSSDKLLLAVPRMVLARAAKESA